MSEKKSIVKPSESHVMLRAVVLNKVNTCVLSNCFKKCFIFFYSCVVSHMFQVQANTFI